MKAAALTLLVVVFYALHQDVWNWRSVDPLLLGFLPVGLWYHVAYSLAASVVLWVLVRLAWPRELEDAGSKQPHPNSTSPHGDAHR